MIREEIKKAFELSGLSQKELSAKTGIVQSSISLYFNGRRDLSSENKERMMQVLNIRMIVVKPGETVQITRIAE